jgi:hypothetical protein
VYSRTSVTRAHWVLAAGLLAACGGAPRPPTARPAEPAAIAPPSRTSAALPASAPLGAGCATDAACAPASNLCQPVVCAHKVCTVALAPPRTACALASHEAALQNRREDTLGDGFYLGIGFQNVPGVCFAGRCLTRVHCAELCGGLVGEELGPPLLAELKSCYANESTQTGRSQCRAALKRKVEGSSELAPRMIQCSQDCGFTLKEP